MRRVAPAAAAAGPAIGGRLRSARQAGGHTLQQVAEATGREPHTWSNARADQECEVIRVPAPSP